MTGLKSSNHALQNQGGSIESIWEAISNSEQSKIASRESQGQSSIAQSAAAQRSAKAVPVKRYAKNAPSNVPPSKKSRRLPVMPKPIHGQTEMASLLQRAFSGY
jgi:hypothetical protein